MEASGDKKIAEMVGKTSEQIEQIKAKYAKAAKDQFDRVEKVRREIDQAREAHTANIHKKLVGGTETRLGSKAIASSIASMSGKIFASSSGASIEV